MSKKDTSTSTNNKLVTKELIEARRELKRIRKAVDAVRISQPMKGAGHGPLSKQFQYNLLYANNFLKTAIEQINEVLQDGELEP